MSCLKKRRFHPRWSTALLRLLRLWVLPPGCVNQLRRNRQGLVNKSKSKRRRYSRKEASAPSRNSLILRKPIDVNSASGKSIRNRQSKVSPSIRAAPITYGGGYRIPAARRSYGRCRKTSLSYSQSARKWSALFRCTQVRARIAVMDRIYIRMKRLAMSHKYPRSYRIGKSCSA